MTINIFFFKSPVNTKYKQIHTRILNGFCLSVLLLASVPSIAAVAPTLGVVDQFGVLGASGVTAAGPAGTVVSGDVGSSPTPSITGFPPAIVNAPSILHPANDAVVQQAQVDATSAVGELNPQACTQDLTGQDLGLVGPLVPGVYCFTSSADLTGSLVLDAQGDPNAVFIFRTISTLTTASASIVSVINAANACNVYWQIGSSATLGSSSTFLGNIFADQSISFGTTTNLTGRAIAQNGAVTLAGSNTIEGCSTSQISVVKNAIGGDDSFNFSSTTLTPNNFIISTAGNTGAQNFGALVPGSYDITETTPSGWILSSATCDNGDTPDDITLNGGESVVCTFTNTQLGTIILEKQTIMNGAIDVFNFTGDVAGNISDGQQIIVNDLVPGNYNSVETALTGWTLTSINCSDTNSTGDIGTLTANFSLEAGETVTCTFTNTQNNVVGSITVEKQTQPDGSTQSFTFTGDVIGSVTDGNSISAPVSPGTYNSAETQLAGWDLSSIVCDDGASATPSIGNLNTATVIFNVDQGEAVRCVFTNIAGVPVTVPAFSSNLVLALFAMTLALIGYGFWKKENP